MFRYYYSNFRKTEQSVYKRLQWRKSQRHTWDILDNISHQCTEVTTNVLQCVRVFVIFSLKQLPGQINILKQRGV